MASLWARMTEGCGRYATPGEIEGVFREAGFGSVASERLVIGEQY